MGLAQRLNSPNTDDRLLVVWKLVIFTGISRLSKFKRPARDALDLIIVEKPVKNVSVRISAKQTTTLLNCVVEVVSTALEKVTRGLCHRP